MAKCTTTGYFLLFFFPPIKKGKEEMVNEVAKPVLNQISVYCTVEASDDLSIYYT